MNWTNLQMMQKHKKDQPVTMSQWFLPDFCSIKCDESWTLWAKSKCWLRRAPANCFENKFVFSVSWKLMLSALLSILAKGDRGKHRVLKVTASQKCFIFPVVPQYRINTREHRHSVRSFEAYWFRHTSLFGMIRLGYTRREKTSHFAIWNFAVSPHGLETSLVFQSFSYFTNTLHSPTLPKKCPHTLILSDSLRKQNSV